MILSLKFTAAGMQVEVVTASLEPHLVIRVPGTSGHGHHGPRCGEHDAIVWLSPGAAPMCCCQDWWASLGCEHVPAALAAIGHPEAVTWPPD